MKKTLLFVICVFVVSVGLADKKKIQFESKDGLEITADLYLTNEKSAPFILFFHQAGWSRGEYNEIAPKMNAMGFNCLAVDLRSGGSVNGVTNETYNRAARAMKGTTYVDAYQDMVAAVEYVKENFAEGKVIAWGSSYSSALSLVLAAELQLDGVLSFSPGEYFASFGKTKQYITNAVVDLNCPTFVTSARDEKNNWWGIYNNIPSPTKIYFVPTSSGNHGSRALWEKFNDSKYYWEAVDNFLKEHYNKNKDEK